MIYTTIDTLEKAQSLAHLVVLNKLEVCANIFAKEISVYAWKGGVEQGNEYHMLFKTTIDLAHKLEKFITENHPYHVPCVLKFYQEASKEFMAYMNNDLV